MCSDYAIKKAEHERRCQELRDTGTKVCNLPPKPKRHPKKEVFNEVRERWARDLEIDEDRMDVSEDEVVSELNDNCLVKILPSYQGDGEEGLILDSGGEDEGDEGDEDEDFMDVDKV